MTPHLAQTPLRRKSFSSRLIVLVLALPVFAWAQSTQPATQARAFDIAADYADKSLPRFSEQSGLEVVFGQDSASRVRTNPVKGNLAPREALDLMLDRTGLIAVTDTKSGAVAVRRETAEEAKNGGSRLAQSGAARIEDGTVKLESIEVTGSRIRGLLGDASFNPMVSFTRADIERAGVSSIGELSRLIPQAYSQGAYDGIGFGGQSGGLSPTGDGSIASTTATSRSTFNLRGLGGANTLVLIDGRRVAKTGIIRGNDAADLAGLPISAIERVEVLLNGASAVYGSDAVGGVINIILRKNYLGTEVALSYENTFDSDSAVRTLTVTQGVNLGKFRAMLSATWQDRHAFAARDRSFSATDAWVTLGGASNLTSYNGGGFPVGPGVVQATSGTLPSVAPASQFARIPTGATGVALPATAYISTTATADLADRAQFVNIISPQVNRSASVRLTYDVSARHELFLDGRYSDTETDIEGLPVNYRGFLSVPADYPGNPFGVPVFLQKAFWELGNIQGAKTAETSNAALSGGGRGALPWGDWRYEASIDWNRGVLYDHDAYDPVLETASYNAAIAARSLVLFYDSRASQPNDPALLRSFLRKGDRLDRELSVTYAASATGTIVDLPAGPLALALGVEAREEKARTRQATPESTAINLSLLGDFERTSESAFLEIRAPVIRPEQGVKLVNRLELSAAIRYDQYSDAGGDESPGFGATYRPMPWMLFRASRNYSFRAPGLQSLYRPITASTQFWAPAFGNVFDRVRNNQVLNGIFATRIGGNLELQPERSISDNFGVVVNVPGELLKGLSFSFDAQNLEYKDRISSLGLQQIIDLFPERVTRGPNLPGDAPGIPGPIVGFDTRAANIAKLELETLDYQLNYQRSSSWGNFDARFALTDYLKYRETPSPGAAATDSLFRYPTRLSWQTYWNKGQYGIGVNGFYQQKQYASNAQTAVRFHSALEWNLQLAYDFDKDFVGDEKSWLNWILRDTRLSLTVFNIFNREPPHVQGVAGFAVTDPRMARYILTLRKTF